MPFVDNKTKRILLSVFNSIDKESVAGKGDGWVNLAKFGPAIKKAGVDYRALGFEKLGDLVFASGVFYVCVDSSKAVPVKYIQLKKQASSKSKQSTTTAENSDVAKVKKRLRLKNNFFIGQFSLDGERGHFKITDIRNTDFTKIEDKERGIKDLTIRFESSKFFNKFAYYRFTWNLVSFNPLEFGIDLSKEVKLVTSNDVVFCINNCLSHYPLDAAKKITGSLDTLSKQLTQSGKEVFIYELLQNANDYPQIKFGEKQLVDVEFHITEDYLAFLHTGAYFNAKNVAAICNINDGEKSGNEDAIGYKGIGFKTVFLDSDYVFLQSGTYTFRFDKTFSTSEDAPINTPWQIYPLWTNPEEVSEEITSIFSSRANDEFRVKFALKPRDSKILTDRERKDNYIDLFSSVFETEKVILFIPYIRKVSVYIGNTTEPAIVREKNSQDWCVSSAMTDDIPEFVRERINDVLTNQDADRSDGYEKIPEKYLNFYKTAVKFACKREGRKLLPIEDAILYCYLPAKRADWGFKFLMNTDMLPNGARDDIEDIELNHEIAKIAGRQFFYWIKELIASKEYELDSIFTLIPDFDECAKRKQYAKFIEEFQEEFESLIKEIPFVPVVDKDGNESLACIDTILDDRTGITEKNVMTDAEFISLLGSEDSCLPIQELRESECFMEFLYHYCPGDMDVDFDDIKKQCSSEEFKKWLENQDNNTRFIGHLLDYDKIEDFSSKQIFIEYEGELFKASDLYYDFDTNASIISFLKQFVPHLCDFSRSQFDENEKWKEFVNSHFMDFDAQSIVTDYIAENDDAIALLETPENSLKFFEFVAQNEIDLSEIKEKIPFISEDGKATYDYDNHLYFYSNDSYQASKESWLGDNVLNILSHIYFIDEGEIDENESDNEDEKGKSVKEIFEDLGFTAFDKADFVTSIIAEEEDFISAVNEAIEDDFGKSVAFFNYVFSCRDLIKDKSLLFKEYVVSCLDIEDDEVYLCNDDLRYFNQPSYAGNSTFEENKAHEWLTNTMMYCLNSKYFEKFESSEMKLAESFFRQQFGIRTFTDKSFFTELVLKNKKTIYAALSDKEKMLAFISYLSRDAARIFDGSVSYNDIKDMPILCADNTIITERNDKVKLIEFSEDAFALYEKSWCPYVFDVIAEEYSKGLSKDILQLFKFGSFDFTEILTKIVNDDTFDGELNDQEKNIDFWRWIKDNAKSISNFEVLKSLSLLDDKGENIECSSLYIPDTYQKDGIESLVKKYDTEAKFVSSEYLEDSETDINEWLKLFKKLGLKFDNKDILLNSVLPNLSSFEDDSVVAMMTKHLKDLKAVWEERKDEIVQLRVRTRSGEYKTLSESIVIDIPEESVVEPFKYISLSDEVAPDIIANNKELLRLVAADCSNHRSISSKQKWAEEKIREYIINIQTDEVLRNNIHVDFIRELAKLSAEYDIEAQLYNDILYMVKCDEKIYKPSTEITLGSAYSPICNFEANGVTDLDFLSEDYIFEGNRDTIKSFFKSRGLHHTMTENDIELLSNRAFALYFWSYCFSKSLSEYEDWITRGLFDDIACIPTETSVKKPGELYYTRMWIYASKTAGWKEKVPHKSIIDRFNHEARDIFDKLPFNPTLSFKECIGYLLNAVDKSEEESSRRKEICNWILEADDIDMSLIQSYRENPNALWRNGKWQKKHITELYVIHPDAKQYKEIFRGNEHVMITNMFPIETSEFERLCSILGIHCLTGDDFVSTPKNKVDQTAVMMKELKPRILVLSAIENAEKYKDKYTKYDEIVSNYRFYVCDEIDLGYDTIHNDVERIYEEDGRIYYVNSWQHSRTFTRFCSKIKNLLGISVVDNVFEDVFDETRTIEQSIEKYCSAFVHDEDFRLYLENLDCSVPIEIEDEPIPEEESYYSDAPENLTDEIGSSDDTENEQIHEEQVITNQAAKQQSVSQGESQSDIDMETSQHDTAQSKRISDNSTTADDIEREETSQDNNIDENNISVSESNNESSSQKAESASKATQQEESKPELDSESEASTDNRRHDAAKRTPSERTDGTSGLSSGKREEKKKTPDEFSYVPDPDQGDLMGSVDKNTDYDPIGVPPRKPIRRRHPKQYTKEELERLRSNGTPLELESLPATDEEINILEQCNISAEQIADTNFLAQLRLYNNLRERGDEPEESMEDFVRNADDVTTHKLKGGKWIHTCSAARGVMYISPTIWNMLLDDKCTVCVYLDGRGKNFHFINTPEEFLQLVEKDDVVIKITGKEKVDVVRELYSGLLENVKGTAYTLVRVASRTNMDAVFAHYVGGMAESNDGNDDNEYGS